MESVIWQTRVAEDLLDFSRQYTYGLLNTIIFAFLSQWVAKFNLIINACFVLILSRDGKSSEFKWQIYGNGASRCALLSSRKKW